ncbi:MAG: dihydrodipicolinate reductase [Hyphomicrobiales bacterium]|nr:dihydrodipicolinate reductase [Hyphomicrobiales bacterium]
MRVAVMGASGRVGLRLVEAVLKDPGLELAAALVSPTSRLLGRTVEGTTLEYRPIEPSLDAHADVFVDFSSPKATLALLDSMGDKPLPVVIGTTGFDASQEAALDAHAEKRPLLIEPNFALGFDAFERAVADAVRHDPGAEATVLETYHARKKAEPSGTSRRVARMIARLRREATGLDLGEPSIVVRREGDVVGLTEVRIGLGPAELRFAHEVHDLAAFAEGALSAARRFVAATPEPGRFGRDLTRTRRSTS